MAIRVEKVWSSILKPLVQRQKVAGSATDEDGRKQQDLNQDQKDKQQQDENNQYSLEEITKILEEVAKSEALISKGFTVELLQAADGIFVLLKQKSGQAIKKMTPPEFMDFAKAMIKASSTGSGNILDQRF